MKLQFNILLKALKKNYYLLIMYFSILFLIIAIDFFETINNSVNHFCSFIGFLDLDNIRLTAFTIFQFIFSIYMSYILFTYDLKSSFEYIILRSDSKDWLKNKIKLIILFVAISRLVIFVLAFIFFHFNMTISIEHFLYPILQHIYICLSLVFFLNINDYSKFLTILFFGIIYYIFGVNYILYLLILFAEYIYLFLSFSFKKYYKINNVA